MTVASVGGENDGPSAPLPGLVLFNTEDQSDIVFNVGTNDSETWRFPAHSFVVGDASPVFEHIMNSQKQVLSGLESKPKTFHLMLSDGSSNNEIFIHCKPEIFHIMLSYIYKNEVELNSVSTTLNLIPVSHQFELHDLTKACLEFLKSNVSACNVLEILSFLRKPQFSCMSFGSPQDQEENILNELVVNCCTVLDLNSEDVLRCDAIVTLDQELLMEILIRDTLNLISELTVFESLVKWTNHQCLKQRRPLTPENKREVLGKALYSARYLVMSIEDFLKGPYSSDILTDEEKNVLLSKLRCQSRTDRWLGFDGINLPMHLLGLKLDLPRTGTKKIDPEKSQLNPLNSPPQIQDENAPKKKTVMKRITRGLSKVLILAIQIID